LVYNTSKRVRGDKRELGEKNKILPKEDNKGFPEGSPEMPEPKTPKGRGALEGVSALAKQ
jgi:hypothetical protein